MDIKSNNPDAKHRGCYSLYPYCIPFIYIKEKIIGTQSIIMTLTALTERGYRLLTQMNRIDNF